MDDVEAEKIICTVPEGWHVVSVAVPTRALRVIRDDPALKFRLEQLHPRPPGVWDWKPISTHQTDSNVEWESHVPAIIAMNTMQARLKEKLRLAQHDNRMANIKAQQTNG